jgi:hypothetical protein
MRAKEISPYIVFLHAGYPATGAMGHSQAQTFISELALVSFHLLRIEERA